MNKQDQSLEHVSRGSILRRLGEWDAALHEFMIAINLDPKSFYAHYEKGLALNGKGNETGDINLFVVSAQEFTLAIAIGIDDDSTLAEVYYNRGCVCTDDLGKHEQAIRDCQQSLRLVPNQLGPLRCIERARAALGGLPGF